MQLRQLNNLFINNLRTSIVQGILSHSSYVKSLIYKEYGDPKTVLQIHTDYLEAPTHNEVIVKWLFAPINPADINTIQGKYPSKPDLPAIPGNEGVGEVVAVGPGTSNFCVGNKVVPSGVNKGIWRSHAKYKCDELFKIHNDVNVIDASILTVNPCTAYRMLRDFINLKNDDTIIQNGGNSAVGRLVIQLCKFWNIKSVNIVRDRPDIKLLKDQLFNLGATEVLTEEELRTTNIFKNKKLCRPKLALNCICGKNAREVERQLDNSGIMVTYGGMSREPLTLSPASLIFKNIKHYGFWMTSWTNKYGNSPEQFIMLNDIQKLFIQKKLEAPPYELVPFNEYKEAVANALHLSGQKNVKYILDLQNN